MKSLFRLFAVSAIGLAGMATSMPMAGAVTFPDAQSFTISPSSEPTQCAEAEGRRTSDGTEYTMVVLRPCSPGKAAQHFLHDAENGYLHSVSVPADQCLSLGASTWASRTGMGSCTQPKPLVFPAKFASTPDSHLKWSNPKGDFQGCLQANGEGQPLIGRNCQELGTQDFTLTPASE
ncbi:RICIN domain-containing protein [Streptomyces bauhiniae]|uniref:RICIN domain-containing protein n=1 Tax=Streptomyces bauhiniae TaxID=2340725 RepID=UPI0036919013